MVEWWITLLLPFYRFSWVLLKANVNCNLKMYHFKIYLFELKFKNTNMDLLKRKVSTPQREYHIMFVPTSTFHFWRRRERVNQEMLSRGVNMKYSCWRNFLLWRRDSTTLFFFRQKNWLLKLLPTYNSFLGWTQNDLCYRGIKSLIKWYIFHVFLPFVFE